MAERLERNPASLAILTLIELAFYPGLMVRAPKSLAVTLANWRHLVLHLKILLARTDRVRIAKKQECEKWTLTMFPDRLLGKSGCKCLNLPHSLLPKIARIP